MAKYSKINFIEPEKLIPYGKNAKTHPDSQLTKLVRLMENYGFPESKAILVDEDLIIIAGHGRRLASISAGLKQVPYQIITNISEADKKALRIADNAVGESEWNYEFLKQEYQDLELEDFDMDLLSLDDIHFEAMDLELEEDNSGLDEDKLDEIPNEDEVETRAKTGDIWQLGNHFLLCGDCTIESNIKALLGDKKVDMVFTDPPYGINWNTEYQTFTDGKIKGQNYDRIANDNQEFNPDFLINKFKKCLFFGANCFSNKLPLGSWVVWDKRYENGSAFLADAEVAWYTGGGSVYIIAETNQGFVHSDEKKYHPTQKPVELFKKIFDKINVGDIVFDPFLGSGTTLIACEKTNRICYGCEISPKYADVIITRWENLTGKTATLLKNIL